MSGKLIQRLQDPSRSGAYRVSRVDEVEDALKGTNLSLVRVPFADKAQLLKNIAAALHFPDWFGHNWDALEDCLTDLSWRDAPGYVLLIESPRPGDDLGVLVDILRSSAEFWAGRGKPFFALFVDPERALPLPELFRQS
ncbi:MAG TPA: barstar family protein [Burkholderiales bacterium]|nr:barstar family protein [Burkholderiales bacterium]